MYVCGVTVYDDCHLGHARSALTFDMIRRYLEFSGYQVTYVRNFTDIDDKILQRAVKEGVAWNEISDRYIKHFYRDMEALGISKPTVEPRATEHMQDIVDMIVGLEKNGVAYQLEGDVYFSVKRFSLYGELSGKNLEELQAGARVEVNEKKRDPMDFALWKAAKPGEPGWDSPWGQGRPGWHIECSAMSVAELGSTFDIHGGGKDLIFPHHENEIAQSSAYTGKEFARYWVHNGFVTVDKEKMSKSLGNFFTIREILDKSPVSDSETITGECLRYYLLSTHYRSDLNFSEKSLPEAKAAMDAIYSLIQRLEEPDTKENKHGDAEWKRVSKKFVNKFNASMDDDFNTPKVLGAFHELRGEVNKLLVEGLSKQTKGNVLEDLKKYGQPLGLFQISSKEWIGKSVFLAASQSVEGTLSLKVTSSNDEVGVIEEKIQARNKARAKKDFATADRIRNDLANQGIILEDRPDGTTRWKR